MKRFPHFPQFPLTACMYRHQGKTSIFYTIIPKQPQRHSLVDSYVGCGNCGNCGNYPPSYYHSTQGGGARRAQNQVPPDTPLNPKAQANDD